MLKDKKKIQVWAGLASIMIVGFIVQFFLYTRTDYIQGQDGGYYAYTVKELLETGKVAGNMLGSPPLFFYVSGFFAFFTGVESGVKIATALFSALTGLSIFILTRYLSGSRIAGLIASFFIIFNPIALRFGADIRKNSAVLFFIPLIFYLFLKTSDQLGKKDPDIRKLGLQFIGLAFFVLLAGLTHKSVIIVWFIILCYFGFKIGVERRIGMKEFLFFYLPNLVLAIIVVLKYGSFSEDLSTINSSIGAISKDRYEGPVIQLNLYLFFLWLVAVPGILAILKRIIAKQSKEIFIGSWLLLSFILTLPQISISHNWRYVLMTYLPLSVTAGYSAVWLREKYGYLITGVFIAPFAIIMVYFLVSYGFNDSQMRPILDEKILASKEKGAQSIPETADIYSDLGAGNAQYWSRYFFGPRVQNASGPQMIKAVANSILSGKEVYFFGIKSADTGTVRNGEDKNIPLPPPENFSGQEQAQINKPRDPNISGPGPAGADVIPPYLLHFFDLRPAYTDNEIIILELAGIKAENIHELKSIIEQEASKPASPAMPEEPKEKYSFERMMLVSSYFILPYEIINMVDPAYRALWQIEIGLPLSMLIFGALIVFLVKKYYLYSNSDLLLLSVFAILVIAVFLFRPGVIWGYYPLRPPDGFAPGQGLK